MPDPNFPGMRVCKEDLDNFDPWRLPARQTENIALRFPRPDVSIALQPNQIMTDGGFTEGANSIFIEGVPPASGAQGDLNQQSTVVPTTQQLYPFVNSVTPNLGTKSGGTPVVIVGANFTSATTVKFGGSVATFVIINSTEIHATTPSYPVTGIVDVSVISPFGTGTSHGAFTYT